MPILPKELEEGRWNNVCEHTLGVVKLCVSVKYVLHFRICQSISLGCVQPHTSVLPINWRPYLLWAMWQRNKNLNYFV